MSCVQPPASIGFDIKWEEPNLKDPVTFVRQREQQVAEALKHREHHN
jgi:hypothetical protein